MIPGFYNEILSVKRNYRSTMKKLTSVLAILILFSGISQAQVSAWKIAGNRITTQWSANVNPLNPLPEYPRPQMVRTEWKNLNGLWDYAITTAGSSIPKEFQGKILVPFAVE